MSDAGAVIGRVSVKVWPDTKGFRKDLKNQLDAIEKTLDGVKIEVNLDGDNMGRQAREVQRKAEAALKDISLKVNLEDEDSLRRGLQRIKNELSKLGEIEIDVDLNEESLRAAQDLLRDELDKVARVRLEVDRDDVASVRKALGDIDRELAKLRNVDIDVALDKESLDRARADLVKGIDEAYRKVRERVEESLKGIVISPDVDPTKARQGIRQIEQALERIEALKLSVVPEMDQESRRKVEREIEDLEDKIEDIKATINPEVSGPLKAVVAAEMAYLTRDRTVIIRPLVDSKAMATAVTSIAALSGARGLYKQFDRIADSILNLDKSIPLIGSLALATAGLAGFGLTAASNLFALSVSLAQIGPAALALPGILGGIGIGVGVMVAALKDFTTVFPDVKAKFAAMQDLISKNFYAEAEGSIRRMLDVLLPQLSAGFGVTATALGGYFAGIADGVRNTLSKALSGMFADLAESIKIATGGTGALVGIITTLGEVGAGYLPRLATWFVDITTRFDEFLSKASADGRLQGWIDTALVNLGALADAIGSLGSIFAGLGAAALAGGGSSLVIFADTMDRIATAVNSPAFQTALTGVFIAAHAAMSRIADISGPAIQSLFEALAYTLMEVLPLASAAIGELGRAIATALADPEMQAAIVGLFEKLKDAILILTPSIGPIGEALAVLVDIVGTLAEVMAPIAAEIIDNLAEAFVNIGPQIEQLAIFLGGVLLDAVEVIGPKIVEFTQFLADHETIAKALVALIGTAMVAAYTAMGVAATINFLISIGWWGSAAAASTASATVQQTSGAKVIAGWVAQAAGAALNAAKVVLGWVSTGLAAIAAGIIHAAQATAHVAKWVLMATAGAAVNAAKIVAGWVITSAGAIASGLVMTAQAALVVGKWVLMAGVAMVNGAIIAGAWLLALGPIGLIIAAVIGAVILIVANWDTIKSAFQTGVAAIIGFVQGLPGKIKGFFSNAGSFLMDAGRKIIQGLLDGITGAFGKVKAKLGELTGMLPDWKGPAKRDATILVNAGQLIIGGLITGMESQYDAVKKSLTGLTKDIGGMEIASPSMADIASPGGAAGSLRGAIGTASEGGGTTKVLNYYAASGSGFSAEEDLFAATDRARMVGW